MSIDSHLTGKTILVTGGTGTFGRAFVFRLLSIPEIKKVIVFSRDEFKQSEIRQEIKDTRLRFFLGDVRDLPRLERSFQDVDIVVHAAALKQVPALEYNPFEAVKTNILGTQNVIEAALNNNVEKVVFMSSDKAVQPINLYGATKLCAEKLCVAANVYRGHNRSTKFSVVRYGNVFGSRGSLVETIEKQRSTGGVKLTDPLMTRFWIMVDKAMGVVFKAIELAQGGEIFVPKMRSLYVIDLIKKLAPDCRIEVVGIRPGEKLHETLITSYEAPRTKDLEDFFVIHPIINSEFGWNDEGWLVNKPLVDSNFVYESNHPDFLFSDSEVLNFIKTEA